MNDNMSRDNINMWLSPFLDQELSWRVCKDSRNNLLLEKRWPRIRENGKNVNLTSIFFSFLPGSRTTWATTVCKTNVNQVMERKRNRDRASDPPGRSSRSRSRIITTINQNDTAFWRENDLNSKWNDRTRSSSHKNPQNYKPRTRKTI